MKKTFLENHYFDEEIEEKLMKETAIIFDTNALLDSYRYTKENRKKFFEILKHENINKRLYMPYQVGYEFYKNMETRKYETKNIQSNLLQACSNKFIEIKKQISELGGIITDSSYKSLIKERKETIDKFIEIVKNFDNNIEELKNDLENEIREIEITRIPEDTDEILKEINEIFKDKVGERLEEQDKDIFEKEAKKRKDYKIPPGYKDKSNGDYIIWKEMINYSKSEKVDILFISNDVKEDWIHKVNGYNHGARKELIEEFKKETKDEESRGHSFFIYTTKDFFELFEKYYKIEGKSDDLKDLKDETKILNTINENIFNNIYTLEKIYYKDYINNFLKSHLANNVKKDILHSQLSFLRNKLKELGDDDSIEKERLFEKILVLEKIMLTIENEEIKTYYGQMNEKIEEFINPIAKITKTMEDLPLEKRNEIYKKIEETLEYQKFLLQKK